MGGLLHAAYAAHIASVVSSFTHFLQMLRLLKEVTSSVLPQKMHEQVGSYWLLAV